MKSVIFELLIKENLAEKDEDFKAFSLWTEHPISTYRGA